MKKQLLDNFELIGAHYFFLIILYIISFRKKVKIFFIGKYDLKIKYLLS